MLIIFPLFRPTFLFDGASNSTVAQTSPTELTLTAPPAMGGGGQVSLSVIPTGEAMTMAPAAADATTPTRNGVLGLAMAETAFKSQEPSMTLVLGFKGL